MIPKTFKRWCEDNGREPSDPGSDRVWRALYEEYRIEHARNGIRALFSTGDDHCQEHGHGCEEYWCGNGGR
jgi:hypothetical protein